MRLDIIIRFAITGVVLLVAILLAVLLWRHYMYAPWTRDGRVRANVVTIAPDVSGIVVDVPVKDNQRVKKGDVLLVIDPVRYKLSLEQAEARVASSKAEEERLEREAARRSQVGTDVVSREAHDQADAAVRKAKAQLLEAEAVRDRASVDLERTVVRAPVSGYVTNLSVFKGDYAQAGAARLAVIDEDSFWICGYFEETKLPNVKSGDVAHIEMLNGIPAFTGTVEGIAKGIGERENPTGSQLLQEVNPTYNWVRLAQRIPVRIRITGAVPEGLSVGMTCTVTVEPKD